MQERKKPEVTTAIILETRRTVSEDKHPVKLRITYQRKSKYYTLKKEHYTKDEFEAIINPESKTKNKNKRRHFQKVEDRAIDIIDNVLNEFSFEAFKNEYLNKKSKNSTIQSLFEEKALELDKENKIQTATLYRSTIKSLTDFDKTITFQKVTSQYLKQYENWMIEKEKSYTTIGIYLRNLKHIINKGIKDNLINKYPFGNPKDGKYQIPQGKNKKKALTILDIEKFFKYKPKNRNEYLALNYWLFSYLCNGMNMVDIAKLKYKNVKQDNIEFIRQKTQDTSKERLTIKVLMLPEVKQILDDLGNNDKNADNYIFPIFNPEYTEREKHNRLKQHIKNTNKYMNIIAENVGINENITTYWARHSYSTILKRSGAPIEFISEQLGHKNFKTTQNYLDSFEDEQREKYSSSLIPNKKI